MQTSVKYLQIFKRFKSLLKLQKFNFVYFCRALYCKAKILGIYTIAKFEKAWCKNLHLYLHRISDDDMRKFKFQIIKRDWNFHFHHFLRYCALMYILYISYHQTNEVYSFFIIFHYKFEVSNTINPEKKFGVRTV